MALGREGATQIFFSIVHSNDYVGRESETEISLLCVCYIPLTWHSPSTLPPTPTLEILFLCWLFSAGLQPWQWAWLGQPCTDVSWRWERLGLWSISQNWWAKEESARIFLALNNKMEGSEGGTGRKWILDGYSELYFSLLSESIMGCLDYVSLKVKKEIWRLGRWFSR